ncbi:MAG: TIGR02530 family flagellar biosynthesis protein [Fimbriimonadaceae bacterium]|mgnify:CR=1 FL=1
MNTNSITPKATLFGLPSPSTPRASSPVAGTPKPSNGTPKITFGTPRLTAPGQDEPRVNNATPRLTAGQDEPRPTSATPKVSNDTPKVSTDKPRLTYNEPDFQSFLQDRLKISGHAGTRLQSRKLELGQPEWDRVMGGVDKAAAKGARESLVMVDDVALVVSVKNRTVITALDKAQLQNNVFTNIDSAVIV